MDTLPITPNTLTTPTALPRGPAAPASPPDDRSCRDAGRLIPTNLESQAAFNMVLQDWAESHDNYGRERMHQCMHVHSTMLTPTASAPPRTPYLLGYYRLNYLCLPRARGTGWLLGATTHRSDVQLATADATCGVWVQHARIGFDVECKCLVLHALGPITFHSLDELITEIRPGQMFPLNQEGWIQIGRLEYYFQRVDTSNVDSYPRRAFIWHSQV